MAAARHREDAAAAAARGRAPSLRRAAGIVCLVLLDSGAVASPNHDEVQAATEVHTSWQQYSETRGRRLSSRVGTETCEQVHMKPMEQLRIGYDIIDVEGVDEATRAHVENVVLRRAINYWSRTLKVHRVTAPLRAQRKGINCVKYGLGFKDWILTQTPETCDDAELPTCGEGMEIPEKYLKPTTVCKKRCPQFLETIEHLISKNGGPPCEECTTYPGGIGAFGYDFMALVSIKVSSFCSGGGTLAHASSCVRDQCDRPIFGWINFCPSMISLDPSQFDRQVSTAIHELAHALAFSEHLFGVFRNPDGTPKVPRNPIDESRPRDAVRWSCHLNSYRWNDPNGNKEYVDLSAYGMLDKFNERGIDSCPCPIGTPMLYPGCVQDPGGFRNTNCVIKMTTPKVREKVQEFFDCPLLTGAELENQPTSPCVIVGSHWEERIFMGELMTSGQFGDYIFLSKVTLAVFEDSGWYLPDYTMADPLVKGVHWGYKLGCSFALDKCVTDGRTDFPRFWCTKNGAKKCSLTRREEIMCVLVESPEPMQPSQLFFGNQMVGDTPEADFCPYYHTPISNHVCTDPSAATFPISNVNFMREVFGADSRCLDSTLHGDVPQGKLFYTAEPSYYKESRPSCLEVKCSPDSLSYDVFAADLVHGDKVKLGTCTAEGQTLSVAWLKGEVTCAATYELCSEGLGPTSHTHLLYEDLHQDAFGRVFSTWLWWPFFACLALLLTGASVALALRCVKRAPTRRSEFMLVEVDEAPGAGDREASPDRRGRRSR